MDCGPTCLRMVSKYYGRSIPLDYLRNKPQYGKEGVSMLGLADAAESIGLKSVGAKLTYEQLINDAPLPAIIHWEQYHFVVLTPQSPKSKLIIAYPPKTLNSNYKNGLIILSCFSTTRPCCISSVYNVVQPACTAAATIRLSYYCSWYLSFIANARIIVFSVIISIAQFCCKNPRCISISQIEKCFYFLNRTLIFSFNTCVDLVGL